ncbi:hypothetical protein NOF04DRAFT_1278968 [Fusarium oxysporum II5]|nr:hypothetical protein NOF04DRAFT_1278968 [Fusarium oxysporum II5]
MRLEGRIAKSGATGVERVYQVITAGIKLIRTSLIAHDLEATSVSRSHSSSTTSTSTRSSPFAPMPPKRPACDPCRAAKLACDHGQPKCLRCQQANRSDECRCRDEPLKRRKRQATIEVAENVSELQQNYTHSSSPDVNVEGMVTSPHKYPNPRWLGTFSHQTLFDHIPTRDYDTNLALAGIFVDKCVETMRHLFPENPEKSINNVKTAKLLFANSVRPLTTDSAATLEDYASQFCQKNALWETLGLFPTAVSRVAIGMTDAQGSCKANMTCCGLSRLAMQFSDAFLDIAISHYCLNDF